MIFPKNRKGVFNLQWMYRRAPGWQDGDTYNTLCDDGTLIQVVKANHSKSTVLRNQPFFHWIVAFGKLGSFRYFEPSYAQKVMCLRELGEWKRIAFEVMPPQNEVVDRADVYHIWEFEHPGSMVYDIAPIYVAPRALECETRQARYHIAQYGLVRYLYFQSKLEKELGWKQKQELKNQVFGPMTCAVEIITEEMLAKSYGCMICFPEGRRMDITLV